MKFREFEVLGSPVLMGKNAEQNDELMRRVGEVKIMKDKIYIFLNSIFM